MSLRANAFASVLAVALVLAFAPGAVGESTQALDFTLGLATQRPSSATALSLHEIYKNPSDPNGKPSPLRKTVLEAPAGTVFDGRAIPACNASDNELLASGPGACPPGSQVGTGTVALMTGFGAPVDPFMIDAALFNAGDGITELFSDHRTGLRLAVGHANFTAPNTLTETPASQPGGPPDGQSAVREVDFRFTQLHGQGSAAFITTPPSCPTAGVWTSKLTATVADGHTYTATSTTPCTPTPAATVPETANPAIRISVTPRRVTLGARVRFRVHLYANTPRCVSRADVRLNDARARTNRIGTATITTRLRRHGTYTVTATHPGCEPAHTTITAASRP